MKSKFINHLASLSPAALFCLLASLTLLIYANTFGHQWTYDDFPVLVENPDILSLTNFFQNSYPGRPLREVTYLLDHTLFGLEPAGYRIQNILWHALNAALIFRLTTRLGGGVTAAWCAALVFLCHPLQVEVVANISHRKDSLALAFSLLAILCADKGLEPSLTGRIRWWISCALCAALACLAKETAVVILPLLVLLVGIRSFEFRSYLLRVRWWLGGLGLLLTVSGLTWWVAITATARYSAAASYLLQTKTNLFDPFSFGAYCRVLLKSWAFLTLRFPWPLNLSLEYVYPAPVSWFDPWVLGGVTLCLLVVGVLFFALRRKDWALVFVLTWMILFWLPTSNLWPLAYLAADRYTYAPSAGCFMLAGLLLDRIVVRDTVKWVTILLLALGLSSLSWQQSQVWASEKTLWEHAIKISPDSSFVLNNLGMIAWQEGDLQRAGEYYERAVEVNPLNAEAQYNLGWYSEQRGDRERALRHYKLFLRLPPFNRQQRESAEKLKLHLALYYKERIE